MRPSLPLDRFLLAALHHHLRCRLHRHQAGAPLDPAHSPASAGMAADARATRAGRRGTRRERRSSPGPLATATTAGLGSDPTTAGVLDLGAEGLVAIAALSTINLGLRTPTEQDALVAGFARYLHTLTGSVQFLIRTIPLDLRGHLQTLREQARALPHPALDAAAAAHRAHLAALTHPPGQRVTPGDDGQESAPGLLGRQTLLILREHHRPGAEERLRRRLDDAVGFLAPLDVAVVALSAAQITTLLTNWWTPPVRRGPPQRPTGRRRSDAGNAPAPSRDPPPRGGDVERSSPPQRRRSTVPDKARPPRRYALRSRRRRIESSVTTALMTRLDDGLDDAVDDDLHDARRAPQIHGRAPRRRPPIPGRSCPRSPDMTCGPRSVKAVGRRRSTSACSMTRSRIWTPIGSPAADRDLVADELADQFAVEGDFTLEADLGDDGAGWWGR